MFFTSPAGIGVGLKEPVAVDFTITHLLLPVVGETPLFGFHEITSKVENGGNVLVRWVGGVTCQHSNSVGNIRSGGHHEIHELTNSGLEGVEQAVVYSTLPQEYSTLTFGRGCC